MGALPRAGIAALAGLLAITLALGQPASAAGPDPLPTTDPGAALGTLTSQKPKITGTVRAGKQVAADPGTWGPAPVALAYQWNADGTPIAGATAQTLDLPGTLTKAKLTVTVTGTKPGYTTAAQTSAASTVTTGNLSSRAVTISGTPQVGQPLTAVFEEWTPATVTYAYAWKSGGTVIPGATASTYVPVAADLGARITVTVTGSQVGFSSTTRDSGQTAPVAAAAGPGLPLATHKPTISGTSRAGKVVTANPGDWGPDPVTLTYQWNSDGLPIVGATADTLELPGSIVGTNLSVTVTGAKDGYSTTSVTSSTTKVTTGYLSSRAPKVTGTAQVGQMLTAVPGDWTPMPVSFTYQWEAAGTPISGATAATFTPVAAQVGAKLTVVVTGAKPGFQSDTRESSSTAAVKAGTATPTPTPTPTTSPPPSDAFTAMRLKWRDYLVGGTVPTQSAPYTTAIATVNTTAADASATLRATVAASDSNEPWSDLDTMQDEDLNTAYGRLRAIALAWATPGATSYQNAALLTRVVGTLDWLNAKRYNTSGAVTAGWWYQQIGIPLSLDDILVLLYDQLGAAKVAANASAIEHYIPSIGKTGVQADNSTAANRAWKALAVGLRGVIVADPAKLAMARDALGAVFDIVSTGDGFYADWSYIDHSYNGGFAYTGGYGASLIESVARLWYLFDGTTWEITDPDRVNAYSWVRDAFWPLMFRGQMMDSTRGREISRWYTTSHDTGSQVLAAVLTLAQAVPADQGAVMQSYVVRALADDTTDTLWNTGTVTAVRLAAAAEATVAPAPAPNGAFSYNAMDRFVLQTPSFAFNVSMHSTTVKNYESISTENTKGWLTGDGMTYYYNDDATQYEDDFWPTVDPKRLSGTTSEYIARSGTYANRYNTSPFVGSVVTASGKSGVSGMELAPENPTLGAGKASLHALKSWFAFDNEVVSLGAGVSSTSTNRVESVVDSRKLVSADDPLTLDGAVVTPAWGATQTLADPTSLEIGGATDMGYVFPGNQSVKLLREHRTGTWYGLNQRSGPTDVRTNDFVSIFFDHGTQPSNAGYSYIVLPGASAAQTTAYAASQDVDILRNDTVAGAVYEHTIGTTGAVFWDAGTVSRGGSPLLGATARSMVTLEEAGPQTSLTIADPSLQASAALTVALSLPVGALVSAPSGVTTSSVGGVTMITVAKDLLASGTPIKVVFADA